MIVSVSYICGVFKVYGYKHHLAVSLKRFCLRGIRELDSMLGRHTSVSATS